MKKKLYVVNHLFFNRQNTYSAFKLINSIDNDDTLTLFIEKKHYMDGIVKYLGMRFENGIIKQCKTQYLRLIEPDDQELEIPNVTYTSIINLPSSDFQKIIRDTSNLSNRLEIKCVNDELIFSLEGPFAKVEIVRSECDGNLEFVKKQNANDIIQSDIARHFSNKVSFSKKCDNCQYDKYKQLF